MSDISCRVFEFFERHAEIYGYSLADLTADSGASLEVLAVHCFGHHAAEIIHIGQAVMAQPHPHNTLDYFTSTTFNYPTMAEAYRVAALNGLNRLF